MKLSISNLSWDSKYDEEMYNYLKEKNFDLEIAPTKLISDSPYDKIDEIKDISNNLKEKYDINIVSMQSIWYGKSENIFESDESRKTLIDYTKKAIDFASSINCNNLVFGCPKNRNMKDINKDLEIALEFFKEIGKYAKSKNVVVALEPNPTIYNTNFLNYTSEAIDFVKKIDIPSIKINYDFGTIIQNNEDINILKDNINLINHIHISEPNLNIIEKREIHKDLFKLLNELNYKKYVSIEMKQFDIKDVKNTIDYLYELNEVK